MDVKKIANADVSSILCVLYGF